MLQTNKRELNELMQTAEVFVESTFAQFHNVVAFGRPGVVLHLGLIYQADSARSQ
jgi:hypothetical protein